MQVELADQVKRRMRHHLRRAGAREIGGVLMAEQLGVNHFLIIDFSVDEETGSNAHFVRSPEHHRAALEAFFSRTGANYGRFNYLGEWHSHPSFTVQPSHQDRQSMIDLVNGERSISFAILMIVRLRMIFSLEYSLSVFVRHQAPTASRVV